MGGLHSRPHGGGYAAARRYRKNRSFVSLSCNTATAMLKHCFSTPRQLSLPSGKSLTVHGCKHRHRFTPSTNRQLPFFHNALKCQVNQLLGGFFMRKHGSSFDYLPNATVESLNTVGRIQLLPNRPGKVEEGYHLCPGRAPTLRYIRVTFAHRAIFKGHQGRQRFFGGISLVNGL